MKKTHALARGASLLGLLLIGSVAYASFYPTGSGTYRLQSSIGTANTTINLSSFKEPISNIPYTMSYLNSSIEFGTLDPQTTKSEFVSFTGITQNSDGSATLTGVSRGLSRSYPFTASSTIAQQHSGQSAFVLSDAPQVFVQYPAKSNNETVTGTWTFSNPINGTIAGQVSTTSANIWTALQTFAAGASTTQFSANGPLYVGTTSTTTIWGSNATSTFSGGVFANDFCISGKCLSSRGTGTVTSVGLSDSNSTITVGSTPVTTSGTITATLNLSHANTWAALQTFGSALLAATRPKFTTSIDDSNGNKIFGLTATGSAINYLSIVNGASGTGPTIASANDSSGAINLNFDTQQAAGTTGQVSFSAGSRAFLKSSSAIDGSLTYEDYVTISGGNDTGTGSPDPSTIAIDGSQTNADLSIRGKGSGNILMQYPGLSTGNVGIGTTTPFADLSVANGTATTTVQFGSSASTGGSCLKLYRTDGSAIYAWVAAGATTFTLTTAACATVTGF